MMIGAVLLQVILIFLNATFASAEIAVISMNERRLRRLSDDGDLRAIRLEALTEQPARFLATIQVAITLAGLMGSAFAAESFAGPLAAALVNAGAGISEQVLKSVSVLLITLVLAYFNLVFGELVPKRIAMKRAERLALSMSGMLHVVSVAFKPLVYLLTVSTNLILRVLGMNPEEEDEQVTEEEIRMLLAEGNVQGNIDEEENMMIQNVFEFDDITAEQICTHRIDMTVLYMEETMKEWDEAIRQSRHTHYPVCGEDVDDVIGVLDTRDYFRISDKSRESVIKNAVDKTYFMPKNMKANVLFRNMKESRQYFSVIVDEYGGVNGIITVHDLVEALVGDLYDSEETVQSEPIEVIGEDKWIIRGGAEITEVTRLLKVELADVECDTFGGYVCSMLGRVPSDGEMPVCVNNGFKIEVKTVKNHRIEEAVVSRIGVGEDIL